MQLRYFFVGVGRLSYGNLAAKSGKKAATPLIDGCSDMLSIYTPALERHSHCAGCRFAAVVAATGSNGKKPVKRPASRDDRQRCTQSRPIYPHQGGGLHARLTGYFVAAGDDDFCFDAASLAGMLRSSKTSGTVTSMCIIDSVIAFRRLFVFSNFAGLRIYRRPPWFLEATDDDVNHE